MKKNFSSYFRVVWLAAGLLSLALAAISWFGFDSPNLDYALLTLNVVMFAASLPCALMAVPVITAANYYLDMSPTSIEGIYLDTVLFFVLGFVQWFWLARIWSPIEPLLQALDLAGGKTE